MSFLPKIDIDFIRTVIPECRYNRPDFIFDAPISVDSRTLQKAEIFLAIKGAQVDGHNFIDDAVARGAVALFVDQAHYDAVVTAYPELVVLGFQNPVQAVVEIARAYRAHFKIPVVGITGTVGKTSTKDMVTQMACAAGMNPLSSFGNQNTLLGIAITVLKVRSEHRLLVCEMGISEQHIMSQLADLVRPSIGVIIKVGSGHLTGLESVESVAFEKTQIFRWMNQDSVAIINGDQPLLLDRSYPAPVVTFGQQSHNDVWIKNIIDDQNKQHVEMIVHGKPVKYTLSTVCRAYALNGAAVAAVGVELRVPLDLIIQVLANPVVSKKRFELINLASGNQLIHDAYNANPESMLLGLSSFDRYKTDFSKYIVVGDMKELGDQAEYWHVQMSSWLESIHQVVEIVCVGTMSKLTHDALVKKNIRAVWFETAVHAREHVVHLSKQRNTVLFLKASQSMNFEDIVSECHK